MDQHETYIRRMQHEARQAKSTADDIMDTAAIEGRDLSDEEKAKVESLHGEWKSAQEKASKAADDARLRKLFTEGGDTPNELGNMYGTDRQTEDSDPGTFGAKTIGEAWVRSRVWKALKAAKAEDRLPAGFRSESVTITPELMARPEFKAASSPLLESNATGLFGGSSTVGALQTLLPGVETPSLVQLAPAVADLLPVIPISTPQATYRVLLARTFPDYPGSEPVAEGATKPTASYEFGVVHVELKKLAAITKISEEWLDDDATVVAWLNQDLPAQLRQEEDEYLITELYDAVADASALTGATTGWDAIAAAAATIQANGFNANAYLITPSDFWTMAISKFGTGAGDKTYTAGGPFNPQNNPWGLRPVISANALTGHPLVGDFNRGAYIQRKGGIRLDSTNSNDTDFEKNLVTIRVEMREAVKKVYPEAFKKAAI